MATTLLDRQNDLHSDHYISCDEAHGQPSVEYAVPDSIYERVNALGSRIQNLAQNVPDSAGHLSDHRISEVTLVNIMQLFFDILKLIIEERELEKQMRWDEREAYIERMEEMVKTFESQASQQRTASLASGILQMAAGFVVPIGYLWGQSIMDKLSSFSLLSSLKEMSVNDFIKTGSTMFEQSGKMYDNVARVHEAKAQGARTEHQCYGEVHKTNSEEETRTLEDHLQEISRILNYLLEVLRMEHETARSTYGR